MIEGDVIVRARRMSAGYGAEPVLHAVDLEIRAGEFWALLGGNGTGKSTFLRVLLGLLPVASGELTLDPRHLPRERIGFVPQHSEWKATLPTTVREFVRLGLVGTSASGSEARERVRWALARVELGTLERRSFGALSGGQRQRALVARALVRRPALLVLDEPTSGLDYPVEEAFYRTLADLHHNEGVTILLVTHEIAFAQRYATRVALFRDGHVLSGKSVDMLAAERLAHTFGAHPHRASP
ncbi:MAG: metal ABC transporter ATP-binding protein [Candidatus Binatia bacterium]